jgi:bleomycin hydrolase
VKDQASTGTCWCFATTSFVEAELLRQGKGEYDLSEMFIVRQKYMNQLKDNFLRQGKGNIGQGSITAPVILLYRSILHSHRNSTQKIPCFLRWNVQGMKS